MNKHVSMLEVDKQCGEKKIKHKWDQEGQRGSGSMAISKDFPKKVRLAKGLQEVRDSWVKNSLAQGKA